MKKTELKGLLGAQLLGKANWQHLSRLALESAHPVTTLLAQHIPPSEAADFWTGHVKDALSKSSSAKEASALHLLKGFIQSADDDTLSGLLTSSVVGLLRKSLQESDLRPLAGDTIEALVAKVKASADPIRAGVLEALTAEDFCFDQVSRKNGLF